MESLKVSCHRTNSSTYMVVHGRKYGNAVFQKVSTCSRQRPRHGFPSSQNPRHVKPCFLCRSNGDTANGVDSKQRMSIDLEPLAEGEYCMPGEVFLDNESHAQYTILHVEVKDYPGLLRVIAWVLNGLQLTVQNARYGSESCAFCALQLLFRPNPLKHHRQCLQTENRERRDCEKRFLDHHR